MDDSDVMIEMHIGIRRDGKVTLRRRYPSGEVLANKVLELGMFDVAREIVLLEFKNSVEQVK